MVHQGNAKIDIHPDVGERNWLVETKRQSAALLLPEWSAQLTTRTGLKLKVRPASLEDQETLVDFFGRVTASDLRFRFLSSLKAVGSDMAHELVDVDHTRTENLLAFDSKDGSLAATAMVAADEEGDGAEVAVAVRSDMKGHGVGWAMLKHACDYAKARGIKRLHSVESCDNQSAISLEREMGFTARPCPDDMSLTILSKDLDPA